MAGISPGVYIHIPFCKERCRYCDFNTYSGIEHLIPAYIEALLLELRNWTPISLVVGSIYFGGGTPSLMSVEMLQRIMLACRNSFHVMEGAEVTLEANPGTVSAKHLEKIRQAGINRLSLGVQSFNDDLLRILGRLHNAVEAREIYFEARSAGFSNINLDLMYGLPGQTLLQWGKSLDTALELEPEHLSLYALTLEEGTPLYKDIGSNKIIAPDSDLAADMYALAEEKMGKNGYSHYEISNWAKQGMECRHNLNYWYSGSYAGVGAGAHSCFNGERSWNAAYPPGYIRRLTEEGRATEGKEAITSDLEKADYVILRLRLVAGLDLSEFKMRHHYDIKELYAAEISYLKEVGLLEEKDGKLRLTSRGRLLGNEVFQRFLPGKHTPELTQENVRRSCK